MKRLDQVFAWILFLLGIIHCALTPFIYHQLSLPAVWSFGTGAALIVTGLLNFVRIRLGSNLLLLRGACIAANLLMFVVAVGATWNVRSTLLSNPQVPLLFIASFGEILFSARRT